MFRDDTEYYEQSTAFIGELMDAVKNNKDYWAMTPEQQREFKQKVVDDLLERKEFSLVK